MTIQLFSIKFNCVGVGEIKATIGFIFISLKLIKLPFWRKQAKFGCTNFKRNLGFRPFVDTYIRFLQKDTHLQVNSIVRFAPYNKVSRLKDFLRV